MTLDVYVIKINDKRIFATSLFVEFELKQKELRDKVVNFKSEFLRMDKHAHSTLLKECSKNIIEMHRKNSKTLTMVDKS